MSDLIPRCRHGNIILGCPEKVCDEQTVYLIEQETRLVEWAIIAAAFTRPGDTEQ
jgi:hypothetical protein